MAFAQEVEQYLHHVAAIKSSAMPKDITPGQRVEDVVKLWSDVEVVLRWWRLFPQRQSRLLPG